MISTLQDFDPGPAIEHAQILLQLMLKDPVLGPKMKEGGREGGYLCVGNLAGQPLLVAPIGIISSEKWPNHLRNASEKVIRLGQNPNHFLSRESRNPDMQMWTGGVRGMKQIFAFSGLPEDGDELLMCAYGERTGNLLPEAVDVMLEEFQNAFAPFAGSPRIWR